MPCFSGKTLIRRNYTMGLDRKAQPDFSLNKLYFTRDKKRSDRMTSTLQRRKCPVNAKLVQAEIERRQDRGEVKKLVFYDKYNDFLIFEGQTLSQTLSVLFAILDFNRSINLEEE